MFLRATDIFFFVNSILSNIYGLYSFRSDPVVSSFAVGIHESLTKEQYIKQVTEFWTDARLAAAIPVPLPVHDKFSHVTYTSEDNTQKQEIILGTAPNVSNTLNRTGYPNTVGKVYFVDGSLVYTCTASVVTSDNKDLIFTAGHCVYSISNNSSVTNLVFIPQYDNSSDLVRPFGTWTARETYALPNWLYYGDLNSDVAAVLLNTLNGQHIQDVVGSQGIRFNSPHSGVVHSFGYPLNYHNGQIMTYCSSNRYYANLSNYAGDGMSCGMNVGSSGGPWLESFDFSTLFGVQISVNSFSLPNPSNVTYGPYFGSSVQSLYYAAKVDNASASSTIPYFSTSFFLICIFAWIGHFRLFVR